jgi:hypothetical protein
MVVANEPRSYREVLAAVLRDLRPAWDVRLVAPDRLDEEVVRLRPDLLVCSRLTAFAEAFAVSWVLLYPGDRPSEVCERGRRRAAADICFDDLLALLDRLAAAPAARGGPAIALPDAGRGNLPLGRP